MNDPMRRLSEAPGGVEPPPVDAIRSRAASIRRRRRATVGGLVAAAAAAVIVVAVIVVPGPDTGSERLAGEAAAPTPTLTSPPASEADEAPAAEDTGEDPSGAGATATRSRAEDGAGATQDSVGRGGPAAAAAVSTFTVFLEVPREPLAPGQEAAFTLRVCNETAEAQELGFSDGQRYDFEVFSDGELVWRWSDGRAFAQVTGSERWEREACRSWEDVWPQRDSDGERVGPGSYEVRAVLTAQSELRPEPRTVCVVACDPT